MMKKITKSKLFYVVLSLMGAILMWFYVVAYENPDKTAVINNIPVVFLGEEDILVDRNLKLVKGNDASVSLTVEGKFNDLSKINRDNILVTVDLRKVDRPGDYSLGYETTFPDTVKEGSISIKQRNPNFYVNLTVKELVRKTIEVRGDIKVDILDGYVSDTIEFDPETIEIKGFEEDLTQVSHALVTLSRTNVDKTVTDKLEYTLIGYEGQEIKNENITSNVSLIGATLPILQTKDINLHVTLIDGGGASEKNAIVEIEPEYVTITGDSETLDGINIIELGVIDLSTITGSKKVTFPILIPNGTNSANGEDSATVTVELKGLSTKVLSITNIRTINASPQYSATVMTQSLDVNVRAPSDKIGSISLTNVRVVVDLNDVKEAVGLHTIKADIYIDGYPEAGAIGDSKVLVKVAEAEG